MFDVFRRAGKNLRETLSWTVRQPVMMMSLCLIAASVLRFSDAKVALFPTWPFVLLAGGTYWGLRVRNVKIWATPSDKFVVPFAYSLCGVFISAIPYPILALIIGTYYGYVFPFMIRWSSSSRWLNLFSSKSRYP